MKRQRLLSMMIVAAVALALAANTTSAGSRTTAGVVISPHAGVGIWIGRDIERHGHPGPSRGPVMVPGPWRHRFPQPWPPRPRVVVVRPPVVEPVIVPAPPVIVADPLTITVWITNSNGSRTSVQLTREGAWYRGPRGEYYTSMPTNEQLRVVYGF
jgi:hypothetical protein